MGEMEERNRKGATLLLLYNEMHGWYCTCKKKSDVSWDISFGSGMSKHGFDSTLWIRSVFEVTVRCIFFLLSKWKGVVI